MPAAQDVSGGDLLDARPERKPSGQVAGRPRPQAHWVAKSGGGSADVGR
ncbi:MAG: hypothetical protein Q8J76_01185 [Desulfobulbaceae bacterium]|nr:hypothetical protein [Desulfobulbaceae bacterium]